MMNGLFADAHLRGLQASDDKSDDDSCRTRHEISYVGTAVTSVVFLGAFILRYNNCSMDEENYEGLTVLSTIAMLIASPFIYQSFSHDNARIYNTCTGEPARYKANNNTKTDAALTTIFIVLIGSMWGFVAFNMVKEILKFFINIGKNIISNLYSINNSQNNLEEPLLTNEGQQSMEELSEAKIEKASKIIAQGYRTPNNQCFFHKIPVEILAKIAGYTGTYNAHPTNNPDDPRSPDRIALRTLITEINDRPTPTPKIGWSFSFKK